MKTLQARLIVFLLLPIALLLVSVGVAGFISARQIMLNEWEEGAILKLQRAAHQIDMQLKAPLDWAEVFAKTAGALPDERFRKLFVEQLRDLPGVAEVHLTWSGDGPFLRGDHPAGAQITPPRYNPHVAEETVSLLSDLLDDSGQRIGALEIVLPFKHLIKDIQKLGWWQSGIACLVDEKGSYLAHTEAWMKTRHLLGGTGDPLEMAVSNALKQGRSYGAIFGPGYPPDHVIGFYKMETAPWAIVLVAAGKDILGPISRFELYYSVAVIVTILSVLLLIRAVAGGMARSVRTLSGRAERVAEGDYGDPLPATTRDEVGQLTRSFNIMVQGLKARDFISNTFGRYVDPQIAKELMSKPEATRLGGEEREVAILMSDIRGFTPISQALSPTQTIHLLNGFFSKMIEVVHAHHGIIVDFFGDGLLAFFDPLEGPVHISIRRAVECGLGMQDAIPLLNRENQDQGLPQIALGVGINAGEVVVGNIGSPERAKYGIVGAAVNATERIQSLAGPGEVVISDPVYGSAGQSVGIRNHFDASLKGINEKMTLYVIERRPAPGSI
jgi:class 3 adenylate cyclase